MQTRLRPSQDDVHEMEKLTAAVCREQGWSIAPGAGLVGERWNELLNLVSKAVQLARSDLADLMEGKDANIEQNEVAERLGGRLKASEKAAPGETIMSLFAQYKREKLKEGKRADTIERERKVVNHFAGFVGEKIAVSAITRSQIRDFKQALSDVPHRWTTVDALKGMNLAEAAKAWRKLKGPTRSPATINSEISALSAFFAWLKKNVYVEENVALGFRSKHDKAKGKYPPYSDRELATLFASPLFVGCDVRKVHKPGTATICDWRYWLPICLLYSGARTGEIAQLECNDIRQEHDVWIFDLVESNENEDKRLKNLPSRRIIPIHQILINAGFLDYVKKMARANQLRVFPSIEPGPRGDWSYKPSKFWASYLKRLDMKRKGLCLHSFRHTFTDECRRRGVEEGLTAALLGHATNTQTSHYGSIPVGPLMARKRATESLSYNGIAFPKS